jgi:enediyne biosynthesis protein E4
VSFVFPIFKQPLRVLYLLVAAWLLLPGCPRREGAAPPAAPAGLFRDVAREAGLDFRWGHGGRSPLHILETLGHGCAFLDYDQDGLLDAFLVGNRRCALFRNLGGGRFAEVTEEAGLAAEGEFFGVAAGDFDNDGYPDLYVTGYGKCVLYRNTGRGGFADVTAGSGLEARGPYDVVTAAAFVDLDGDGRLDLFAGRYIRFTPESPRFCQYRGVQAGCGVKHYDPDLPGVYRNNGDGTFADVTREWGFDATHGRCLGVAVSAAEDGRGVNLYAANDELPADFMVPEGRRYRNAGVSSGTAYSREGLTQGGMGTDWGDFDNDGRPDLVVATFQSEAKSLYRSEGRGLFTEVGAALGIAAPTFPYVAWTARFFDFDNDGWLDLFFTNGHTQDNIAQSEPDNSYPQPLLLFRNEGGQSFRLLGGAAGPAFERPIAGRGAAFGDFDNDGRVDVLVVDAAGPALLLRNEAAPAGHWLGVRLVGTRSNRDGIGARVTVTAGGRTLVRDQQLAGGYISAHDPRLHFGLGDAARIDSVAVRWPNGHVDLVRDVPLDSYVEITEGQDRARRLP